MCIPASKGLENMGCSNSCSGFLGSRGGGGALLFRFLGTLPIG
jgi:hypothetical protein